MIDNIYLFDTIESHENLLPLSFTRPIAAMRVGIVTIKEKWEHEFGVECSYLPVAYQRERFGNIEDEESEALFIFGGLLPDENIMSEIKNLKKGEGLCDKEGLLVLKGNFLQLQNEEYSKKNLEREARKLNYVFDIFLYNSEEIERDFPRVTNGRKSASLPDCTRLVGEPVDKDGKSRLFIEEDAEIECISINLTHGPVYIGKNAVIMEGSCLRGPLAVGEHTEIRMGAKIYGGTTFGPYCKVGGEIDNSVIFGYSNKAHDGYLGNAVIGEWCNIGAGVNASNLKNDYSKIRIWNYRTRSFMRTDLQFCGMIMGDHSKIGINCMINTATVIGVGVNIHGSGFPRVFVPSFCEGSPSSGFLPVGRKKFQDIADRVMSRRDMEMGEEEKNLYDKIYETTEEKR